MLTKELIKNRKSFYDTLPKEDPNRQDFVDLCETALELHAKLERTELIINELNILHVEKNKYINDLIGEKGKAEAELAELAELRDAVAWNVDMHDAFDELPVNDNAYEEWADCVNESDAELRRLAEQQLREMTGGEDE